MSSLAEVQRRVVAAVVRSEVWAFDGYRSASPWIAFHSGVPVGRVRRLRQQATTMVHLHHAPAAALDGVLHHHHVEAITTCQRMAPQQFDPVTDELFTAVAASGDPDGFSEVVRAWRAQVDALHGPDPDTTPGPEREWLRLTKGFEGWWHGGSGCHP